MHLALQEIKKETHPKMKSTVLLVTNYLPCVEYFSIICQYQHIAIENYEYFEKQTFRNRCFVKTSQGPIMLSIPLSGRHGKVLTKDVTVEPGKRWRNTHWRTIESSYRKAPFFEFYSEDLKEILFRDHELLVDLNNDLLSFCLQSLKMERSISATMSYEENPSAGVENLRKGNSVKNSNNVHDSFQPKVYQQVFGNSFVSNLSIIDLLFCCGPDSLSILKSSFKNKDEF
jgi:hypothetical protein